MATTSQRLAEGARRSKETQATTALLPAYIAEFQSVFAKEDFDVVMPDSCLGNKSDIFHHNNENNQLKKRVRPPRDIH